jgi:hypothetical protein
MRVLVVGAGGAIRRGSYSMRLANTGLRQPNESIRCGTVCLRIVYSVRIGPPQPNFLSFQELPRTPQPSELTIPSFNGREQNRPPMTKPGR